MFSTASNLFPIFLWSNPPICTLSNHLPFRRTYNIISNILLPTLWFFDSVHKKKKKQELLIKWEEVFYSIISTPRQQWCVCIVICYYVRIFMEIRKNKCWKHKWKGKRLNIKLDLSQNIVYDHLHQDFLRRLLKGRLPSSTQTFWITICRMEWGTFYFVGIIWESLS